MLFRSISQLDSNQSLVRTAAISKLEALSEAKRYQHLVRMLKDPVRAVRTEAARVLTTVSHSLFDPKEKSLFEEVLQELIVRYEANLDRAESHLSLGILAENKNLAKDAEKHYRNAITRDDLFVPARMNLATLLSGQGRGAEAEKLLREAVLIQPTWGQIHYSLGL